MVNANDTLGSRPDGSNFHLIHPRVGHDRIPPDATGPDGRFDALNQTEDGPVLIDSFRRRINNLRISVTDRCNLRCVYCMPAEDMRFLPRGELLSFEEIERVVRIVARMGVSKLRLTGGEPLVRSNLDALVRRLYDVPGIGDIGLTTNGVLLKQQAGALYDAGLRRLNVSLDAISPEKFATLTRREQVEAVTEGLDEARRIGFKPIKINSVVMAGFNEDEILPLARMARDCGYQLRFIEFMPLDADGIWERGKVISGEEIRRIIGERWPLSHENRAGASEPARVYRFADGEGDVGFINSVTEPFCGSCNRIRLTAEGKLRTCLFSIEETEIKPLLRDGTDDETIARTIARAVLFKEEGHGFGRPDFIKPERSMSQIGG
jgi:cyclic pyranopterin phosphate synthase